VAPARSPRNWNGRTRRTDAPLAVTVRSALRGSRPDPWSVQLTAREPVRSSGFRRLRRRRVGCRRSHHTPDRATAPSVPRATRRRCQPTASARGGRSRAGVTVAPLSQACRARRGPVPRWSRSAASLAVAAGALSGAVDVLWGLSPGVRSAGGHRRMLRSATRGKALLTVVAVLREFSGYRGIIPIFSR
jgi:hypothetical protein